MNFVKNICLQKQIAQRSERLARGLGRNELGGRLQEHILDHFEKAAAQYLKIDADITMEYSTKKLTDAGNS